MKHTLPKYNIHLWSNNDKVMKQNANNCVSTVLKDVWCFEVIISEKALIHNSLLLLGLICLVAIQRLIFLLFTVSDVITLILSIILNSTCDDSVNTTTGLKCTRFVTIEDNME